MSTATLESTTSPTHVPRAFTRPVKRKLPAEYRDGGPTRGMDSNALGLFSIGLGMAEVLAPDAMAHYTGAVELEPPLIKAYGLREIATGIGILASRRPAPWLWARVAGDALDLITLLAQSGEVNEKHQQRLFTSFAAVAGVTAVDVYVAWKHSHMQRGTCKR